VPAPRRRSVRSADNRTPQRHPAGVVRLTAASREAGDIRIMKILAAVDAVPTRAVHCTTWRPMMGAPHEYTVVHAVGAVPPRAAAVLDKGALKAQYDDEGERVLRPVRTFFAGMGRMRRS
jgi:hypothetical protein